MANMELIETKTVGSGGASSIQFNPIPQTYTDLKLVVSARGNTSNPLQSLNLTFNSSRTTNLVRLYAYGSTIASDTSVGNGQGEGGFIQGATATANTFSNNEIYISNYRSTTSKSYSNDNIVESNTTTEDLLFITAGLNSSVTTAITSITLDSNAGNFVEFSTVSLYGISSVPSSPNATGGIVSQDATYWYHMFPFSSTFTPTTALSADILVIAGGGGGSGANYGGGGGAGGLRGLSAQSLTTTTYTVTVGNGGAGGTSGSRGTNGGNSSIAGSGFTTITASGGGGGGADSTSPNQQGLSGGSGGGNYNNLTSAGGSGNTGGYTPVEGYAGGAGSGNAAGSYGAGGGGGSGGAANSTYGYGGIGSSTYSSWGLVTGTGENVSGTVYYAGGGGGGGGGGSGLGNGDKPNLGGAGGGGRSGTYYSNISTAGLVNTGGGGGGIGGTAGTGQNGGSGLVIIRYAK